MAVSGTFATGRFVVGGARLARNPGGCAGAGPGAVVRRTRYGRAPAPETRAGGVGAAGGPCRSAGGGCRRAERVAGSGAGAILVAGSEVHRHSRLLRADRPGHSRLRPSPAP